MTNIYNLKKNKKGYVGTALLIAIFVIALVIVIFLALNKNDNVVYTNKTTSNGNTKIIAKTEEGEIENSTSKDGDVNVDNISCEILNSKEEKFQSNINIIKDAAKDYFTVARMPKKVGDKEKLTIKQMQNEKLILGINDNTGKTCDTDKSYVEVTKMDNEYVMKIYLSCSNMEDYVLVHIGCYDFCSNKCQEVAPNEYEYEYKKTTACKLTDWSSWSKWSTIKEEINANKKEEVKTETSKKEVVDTINATKSPVTYNCDKYPGYKLEGDKCVKITTTTDTVPATYSEATYNCNKYPGYTLNGKYCEKTIEDIKYYDAEANKTTYNCDNYPGYRLDGDKCVKSSTVTERVNAKVDYSCESGYTLSGTNCVKTISSTDTKDAKVEYVCESGYTLSGTNCVKTTTTTDTKKATAKHSTMDVKVSYPCNEQKCTTKTVMDCSNGCQMMPQTSCETVKKTCYKNVSQDYISGYTCESGYTLSGTSCTKKITNTEEKKAEKKLSCESGYTLSGDKCVKTNTNTDTKKAEKKLSCTSGYTLSGDKCVKTNTNTDTRSAEKKLSCTSGYTLSGNKCVKTTTNTDTKSAEKKLSCTSGYTLSGNTCVKTTTTTDTKNADKNKVTYNCNKYTNATLNGSKCVVTTIKTDRVNATSAGEGYVCKQGYTLSGTKCTKQNVITDKKDATSSKITYSCPSGYTLSGTNCSKTTTKNIETKYYRYSTRNCEGGKTDIKWSSDNDTLLINDGYIKTGNKRLVTGK